MSRIKGWEKRLASYVSDCATMPFRPGKMDCGLFFMGGMEAMTGRDISKPFRGKYRTIKKAMEIARSLGCDDHVEYVASILEERPSPLMAQVGDCAVVDDVNGSPALGIVQGEHIYVMGLNGIGIVPLTEAKRVFIV
jgi:hypothetical protein